MRLGLDPHYMEGEVFPVGGISGAPGMFKKIQVLIQIGDLRPIWIPCGLGMADKILYEDLAGRAGIFDGGVYVVSQDERGVTFTEKQPQVAMLGNAGGRISSALLGNQGAWW